MDSKAAESWRSNLITAANGAPKPLLANAIIALRDAPAWTGVLTFNEFSFEAFINETPPWDQCSNFDWMPRPWTPLDDVLTCDWLQHRGIAVTVPVAAQAVEAVARDHSFHPVADYLGGLEHDGRARITSWLSTCLGVERTPYSEAVGRAMMIGAVARIFQPGCKVDTMPILEGAQGTLKSTGIKALFEPWFSDEIAELGSKDASMQTKGVWGIEIGELDAMSRGEVSKIKAFISRTTDRFRPPYGSRIIESPRSCVFWGSTNAEGYLKDETGGRRFWPLTTNRVDVDRICKDRDQLWAEAVIHFEANVPWWLTKDETRIAAESEQSSRYIGDAWDNHIADYLGSLLSDTVTIHQIFQQALDITDKARWGQSEQNRVARCLRRLGWARKQIYDGGKPVWKYIRPPE